MKRLVLLSVLALGLFASVAHAQTDAVTISYFAANPTVVAAGGVVTFHWSATGNPLDSTEAAINLTGGASYSPVALTGTATSTPMWSDAEFTILVDNPGASALANVHVTVSTTGIENLNGAGTFSSLESGTITIFDLTGKEVMSYPISQYENIVDNKGIPRGIYIARLSTTDGRILEGKKISVF